MSKVNVVTIAKECGVSPSTVCRALNERSDISKKTRQKILDACQRLGYSKNQAASNLRLDKSNVIACIMPDQSNELFIEKLYYLKTAVRQAGYTWQLKSYSDMDEACELLQRSVSSRVSGIIVSFRLSDELYTLTYKNKIPVVAYDCFDERLDCVNLDRTHGSFDAVDYLLTKGCQNVLMLGADLNSNRGQGYANAYHKHGSSVNNDLIIDIPFGRNLFQYGYERVKAFYGKLDFDSIYAVNDAAAIGACRALAELEVKVPEDIAVIGFDNIMVSQYVSPALTTVSQPKEIMAEYCLKFLVNRMNDKDCARQEIILNMSLNIRETA